MAGAVEGPWAPGRLYVSGASIETDPLSTWWVEFDQSISGWKQERVYIDARDAAPETFPSHPAKLLGEGHPRLRSLLAITPMFALGNVEDAPAMPEARIYRVGFVRTADDYFSVDAEGPGMARRFGAPLLVLEDAAGMRNETSSNEPALMDRVLAHVTQGKLTERSVDLAELWSALAGGPSLFGFGESERREYLAMLEASLEEVCQRAEAQRATTEEIEAALQTSPARIELPHLGPAERWELAALTIEGRPNLPGNDQVMGVFIAIDGKSEMTLPAVHGYRLDAEVPAFEPQALRSWKARATERLQREHVRLLKRRAADARRLERTGILLLLFVGLVLLGACVHRLTK